EDDSTTSTLEIGTDLILLDTSIQVGVIRGKVAEHTKYAGRRIFNAGINLTHLYHGQISLVDFFLVRDMGYLHKMYRGLSGPEFPADSPAGQVICDRVVPDGGMDAALDETISALVRSGVVSAAGNRKAMRIGQESIDLFRQYMALYAREQAYCHYSPQLISNLERNWNAAARSY